MSQATIDLVNHFNDVFNTHDVNGIMALMTEDVVFENTSPQPNGERYEGQEAVRGFWEDFFASSPNARFEAEDIFATEDRCLVQWIYHWSDTGHIRGVDVFKTRDGKIAEKFSYVKG